MDRCTGHNDIIEVMLKTVLNNKHLVNVQLIA